MGQVACYSEEELRHFLLGRLPEGESEQIALHLESCTACEETVVAFDRDHDTLVAALKQAPSGLEELDEPGLRESLQQAKRIPFDPPDVSAPDVSQTDEKHSSMAPEESSARRTEVLHDLPRLRDYRLLGPLGRGGMGIVYWARHERLHRDVAIKLLPARRLGSPDALTRFEREMQAIGQLHHPAIVAALDAGEEQGVHYLAMEFVDGIDLNRLIKIHGPLQSTVVCSILATVAEAMAYAHEREIVHRDIKPSNIMITVDGQVKVMDLGLALLGATQGTVDELTTVGQLLGTLDFMAPEQIESCHEVDARADIYSLAATAFKLVAGESPFDDRRWATPLQKLRAMANLSVRSVRDVVPELSDPVGTVIDRCLSREPAARPSSMKEVAKVLNENSGAVTKQQLGCLARDALRRESADDPSDAKSGLFLDRLRTQPAAEDASGAPDPVTPAARRPYYRALLLTVAAAFLLAMGVVVTIMTNRGQITIETARPDVEVQISKSGEPTHRMRLRQDRETVTVSAGEYEITLLTDHDELTIEGGRFTLKRGGEWLARIMEKPAEANANNAAGSEFQAASEFPVELQPAMPAPMILDPNEIRIGQRLKMEVPVDKSLNRDVDVMNDGSIIIPIAGRLHIAGKSLEDAAAQIQRKLEEYYTSAEVYLSFSLEQPHAATPRVTTGTATTGMPPSSWREWPSASERTPSRVQNLDPRNLKVGQILDIEISQMWQPPRRVAILADGSIVLPVVGAIPAAGRSLQELQEVILHSLARELHVISDQPGAVFVSFSLDSPPILTATGDTSLSPPPAENPNAVDDELGPSYQGKSFEYWLWVLDRERDPVMAAAAVEAVSRLGANGLDGRAADAILRVSENFALNELDQVIVQGLGRLQPDKISASLARFLREGRRQSQAMAIHLLSSDHEYFHASGICEELATEIARLAESDSRALEGAQRLVVALVADGDPQAALVNRALDLMEESNEDLGFQACTALLRAGIESERMVLSVNEWLSSGSQSRRSIAVRLSEKIPRSSAHLMLEGLISIVDDVAKFHGVFQNYDQFNPWVSVMTQLAQLTPKTSDQQKYLPHFHRLLSEVPSDEDNLRAMEVRDMVEQVIAAWQEP